MIIKVKLSSILQTMQSSDERFLCHAVAQYHCGVGVDWNTHFIVEECFITSIQNIVGQKYSATKPVGLIDNWLVNLPGHLRQLKNRPILRTSFRIKLLKWMIKKFGDQEIDFVVIPRRG